MLGLRYLLFRMTSDIYLTKGPVIFGEKSALYDTLLSRVAQPSTFAPRKWRFIWKNSRQLPSAPFFWEQYRKAKEIRNPKIPTGSELEIRTFERAATKLEKFDRYEHRALIRRNRAFRALHKLEANLQNE